MAVTLKDIAKEAGVSVTTVSMVLREDPHPMISSKTRQNILEVARRMKYRHNLYARSLRLGKSRIVGLMTPGLGTRLIILKIEALEREIRAKDYRPLLRSTGGDMTAEQEFIRELASTMVEGLILLAPSPHLSSESLELLLDNRIPIVTLYPLEDVDIDCVTVDRRHGAYIATKHLLELGHRRIALLHGDLKFRVVAQRVRGYREALMEFGVREEEALIAEAGPNYRGGYEAAQHILTKDPRPTALFCMNDEAAIGAMKAVHDAGLRTPEDVAIIGFDNIEAAAYATVPLTSVAQPVEEEARLAVEMLFRRIENPDEGFPLQTVKLKPHLVVRESCGARRRNRGENKWQV